MRPWPSLEPFGRTLALPKSELDLFFFDSGLAEGAPILLVHGLGDEADSWRHIIPELSNRHRVLVPDLPAFGCSYQPHQPRACGSTQSSVLYILLRSLAINRKW